jgi:hypothetical protein
MFFAFPEDARWNAEQQAAEFRVVIGEYEGVVRVPRRVFQRLLPERPTPERCVEAYYLQRTRFESIAERKLSRRQLTLEPEQSGVRYEGRPDRHAVVEQRVKGFPVNQCCSTEVSLSLERLNKPQQRDGGGSSGVLRRSGKHSLQAHIRGCQTCLNRVNRYLLPTDEVRGGRQLVFIADRTGVAAKEVEVDKDRVVWAVGHHVQGQ